MEWINYIVSILSGLAVAVPLVIKLVEYVQKSIKEKNWGKILNIIINLVEEAETKFNDNVSRKEWVMASIQTTAASIGYELDVTDYNDISKLIDDLCKMAKTVNTDNSKHKSN